MERAACWWILIELSSVPSLRLSYPTLSIIARNYLADGVVDAMLYPDKFWFCLLLTALPPPTNQIPSSIFSALSVRFVMMSLVGSRDLVSLSLSHVSIQGETSERM